VTRRAVVASAPLVAALAAACGGQSPAESPEAKVVAKQNIEWWTGWGASQDNGFKQVQDAANAQARTYQVTWTRTPSVAKKLAEVIAAGSPPDVEAGNLPYAEFWVQGYAEPLDQRISKSKVIKKDDLPASAWKFAGYKGKTYGIPAVEGFIRWGMAANEELLAKQGLDPTKLPTTWDDLLDWHKRLTIVNGGTIQQLGLDPLDAMGGGTGGPDPLLYGPSWGIHFYDEGKDKFDLTNPALEEALGTIKKFYDLAGGAGAVAEFRKLYGKWTGPQAGIAVGTQAMQINGPWTPGELARVAPEKKFSYSWVPVPNTRRGKKIQSTGGHFSNLPKGSPHPDQGFEFMEFLWSDQALNIIFENIGWLTARKSWLAKLDASRYRGLDFYVKSVTTADEMWEAPVNPIDGFFGDNWNAQVTDVLNGKISAKSALAELQRLCTEELQNRLGKK
jgi:maltose-binding protein MalE